MGESEEQEETSSPRGQSASGPVRRSFAAAEISGLLSVGLAIVGSIGPWAVISDPVGSITKYGLGGDGVLTLLGAGLALLFFLVRAPAGSLAMSGLMLAVVVYDLIDLNRVAGNAAAANIDVTAGWGIWLAGLGAIGIAVSAVLTMRRS